VKRETHLDALGSDLGGDVVGRADDRAEAAHVLGRQGREGGGHLRLVAHIPRPRRDGKGRREPEVGDLQHRAFGPVGEQEVLGLEVPVADPAGVAAADAREQLPEVAPGHVLGRATPDLDAVKELAASHHLEHEEEGALGVLDQLQHLV
jgi:hypothetical protein